MVTIPDSLLIYCLFVGATLREENKSSSIQPDGTLAGDDSSAYLVAVLDDLQQISLFPVCRCGEQEIIDDQELHPA